MSRVISIKAYKRRKNRWKFEVQRSYSPAHPKNEQIAHIRFEVLKAWNCELQKKEKSKTKTETTLEFLRLLNSGLLIPKGTAFKLKHVGRATLYNWNKRYQDGGFRGLAPRFGWRSGSGTALSSVDITSRPREIKIPGPPKANGKDDARFWVRQYWGDSPLECPLQIGIFYSMPVPRKTKKRRYTGMLRHEISHTRTPHLDTLNAFVMDSLLGIVFLDYRQVVLLHSEKAFSSCPQTRIIIKALPG